MSIRVRMRGRDATEQHRASSPLELLFDLTFVVAIGQLASQLVIGVDRGPSLIGPYLIVFFVIWWAWISFTWFASAYDTDDALYRIFAVVQMAGVLVIAAGVPSAFEHSDYTAITFGYLVMRIGLLAQWVRVAVQHPEGRATALRYVGGIAVLQLGWILRLLVPERWALASFLALVVLELVLPLWAERTGRLVWHPGHIAERYGLFVIILLGESVLAASNGVRASLASGGVTSRLVIVGISALVLLVSLWWIYFLEPTAAGLASNRDAAFFWGYGHYLLFAALGGLGSWLEISVLAVSRHTEISRLQVGYALAAPVAIVLILVWLVHLPFSNLATVPWWVLLPGAAVVLLVPLAAFVIGVPGVAAGIATVVTAVVVTTTAVRRVAAKRALEHG